MKVLVKKMSSLKLLKVELILGTVFSVVALLGLPIGLFCVAPELLTEPLAWIIVLCGILSLDWLDTFFLFILIVCILNFLKYRQNMTTNFSIYTAKRKQKYPSLKSPM